MGNGVWGLECEGPENHSKCGIIERMTLGEMKTKGSRTVFESADPADPWRPLPGPSRNGFRADAVSILEEVLSLVAWACNHMEPNLDNRHLQLSKPPNQ